MECTWCSPGSQCNRTGPERVGGTGDNRDQGQITTVGQYKEVTELLGPSKLKTQPVPGNLWEAGLADSRPWAACQVFANRGAAGSG